MTLDYEIYKEGGLLRDRYQKLEDISEGSYGYVSLAKDTKLKKLVAVKYIFKTDEEEEEERGGSNSSSMEKHQIMIRHQRSLISEKVRSKLSNHVCFEALYEVDIQSKVGKHNNITELYDYFDSYIIMEYCTGGDLYEAIKADLVPRKTRKLTHILSQLMDAVEFVHNKNVYHRDIKPENILIADSNWTIKLTDWGLATTKCTSMDRNVGSERYMAPELFESNLDYDERNEPYECSKVDIWAIGIVLLNLVFHKNPFSVANQTDKSFCYFAANREALFDVFPTMSYDLFQLLRHSLTIDPTNRYLQGMREELTHLSEYTLDDEFYNSIEDVEDEYERADVSSNGSNLPNSPPASVSEEEPERKPNSPQFSSPEQQQQPVAVPSPPQEQQSALAPLKKDPVPRFTFKKRSHPKRSPPLSQHDKNNNIKPIKIKHNRKIIKNTRKPLGIPTPNSHINNFFYEYNNQNDSQDFNTRDFFTPPSVHNRYMEGFFGKGPKHKKNYDANSNMTFNHNHSSSSHYYHISASNRPNSANSTAPRSSGHNSNTNAGNGYSRRGSAISAHSGSPSTGKYVPPHSRNNNIHSSNQSATSPSRNIVQDNDPSQKATTTTTFHEQQRLALDVEPELDDVLFTLEESDVDNSFINDISNLAIEDNAPLNRDRFNPPRESFGTLHSNPPSATTEIPDLLKYPTSPASSALHNQLNNFNFNNNHHNGNIGNNTSITSTAHASAPVTSPSGHNYRPNVSSEFKARPGIYIPPHHRKSFNQGSYNSQSYGVAPTITVNSENYNAVPPTNKKTVLQTRRYSSSYVATTHATSSEHPGRDNYNPNSNNLERPSGKFNKPYMPKNHASSTTAIQHADVFAESNSVAVFDHEEMTNKKKMLNVHTPHGLISGRRSSIQDDLVGSLEQYKNNWLILQQYQD